MKKLLHWFNYTDLGYITCYETCYYCHKTSIRLYTEIRNTITCYPKLDNKNTSFVQFEKHLKWFNENSHCHNGITEEEYIIKKIIE